jgi:predicted nucleic acid-binding protein
MAKQIEKNKLLISTVAFEEVKSKTPDCGNWLEKNNIHQLEITNAILQDAMRIKKLIGIENDQYHPKGVGENDILIIATAKNHKAGLVSNEGRQKTPDLRAKMKIPAVCAMKEVNIPCINFLDYIKHSNEIFR